MVKVHQKSEDSTLESLDHFLSKYGNNETEALRVIYEKYAKLQAEYGIVVKCLQSVGQQNTALSNHNALLTDHVQSPRTTGDQDRFTMTYSAINSNNQISHKKPISDLDYSSDEEEIMYVFDKTDEFKKGTKSPVLTTSSSRDDVKSSNSTYSINDIEKSDEIQISKKPKKKKLSKMAKGNRRSNLCSDL